MKTNINYTYEILNGYAMNDTHINVDSLTDNIWITAINTIQLYEAIRTPNKRQKTRNLAIMCLMYWINENLKYCGHSGYYATNKQVMKYDQEHGNDIEKVLDLLVEWIEEERNEI